jgi:hypothetical protein
VKNAETLLSTRFHPQIKEERNLVMKNVKEEGKGSIKEG